MITFFKKRQSDKSKTERIFKGKDNEFKKLKDKMPLFDSVLGFLLKGMWITKSKTS